jgi:hypothetical protein
MQRWLASLALVGILLSAGCTGVLSGGDLEFSAGETVVDNETATEAGYELVETDTQTLNESVEVQDGNTVNITAEGHVSIYQKAGDDGLPAGTTGVMLNVITTPDMSVAGQSLNPLLQLDGADLLGRVLARDTSGFKRTDNYTVETLGTETNVSVFVPDPEGSPNEEPAAYIHLLQVSPADSNDAVVAFGTYPASAADEERDSLERLLSNLGYTPPESENESSDG